MSNSSMRFPGEETVNLKNVAADESLIHETSAQEDVVNTHELPHVPILSEESSDTSEISEESSEEESLPTSWVTICSDRNNKVSGVVGTMTSTFAYCVGFAITGKPWVGSLMAALPAAAAAGMTKIVSDPSLGNLFALFGISAGITALGNTVGAALHLESYPLLVPIVVFNAVSLGNLTTPCLCLGAAKAGKKLASLSKNCFTLWNDSAELRNKNNDNNNLEMRPLNVRVDGETPSYASVKRHGR